MITEDELREKIQLQFELIKWSDQSEVRAIENIIIIVKEYAEQNRELEPEQLDKMIHSIPVNQANFEYIAKNGMINGSLLHDLRLLLRAVNKNKLGYKIIS